MVFMTQNTGVQIKESKIQSLICILPQKPKEFWWAEGSQVEDFSSFQQASYDYNNSQPHIIIILNYIQIVHFFTYYQNWQSALQRVMELLGFDDNKKIGMFLLTVSMICYTLGVMFLFRRSLILMGNILFLLGLYFFIGVSGILKFFTKKGKIQGSGIFFIGLVLIVLQLTFIGTLMQMGGLFIIFRTFLPDFYDYLCRLPFVGSYLKSYKIQNALDKLAGNQNSRI